MELLINQGKTNYTGARDISPLVVGPYILPLVKEFAYFRTIETSDQDCLTACENTFSHPKLMSRQTMS